MALQKLSPILWTKDLHATILFYKGVMGFNAVSNYPNFVTLKKDSVEIMFIVPTEETEACENPKDNQDFFPKPLLTGSIFITIDNADNLWERVKNKATIKTPIEDRNYMMRDFSILDNNGYELVFGHDIS